MIISLIKSKIKMSNVRKSYTSEKKLEIIEYAEKNSNRAAARLYVVGESSVREWRKQKAILQVMNPRKRARRYKKEFWPELEQDLKKWIREN